MMEIPPAFWLMCLGYFVGVAQTNFQWFFHKGVSK